MKKGKPLDTYLDEFYTLSGKASDITRSLSLAGIAIVWIFKTTDPATQSILLPCELKLPLKWVVLSLILDVLQYIYMAIAVKVFHRVNERKLHEGKITELKSQNLLYPAFAETVSWVFFIGKVSAMFIGYYFIYSYLTENI